MLVGSVLRDRSFCVWMVAKINGELDSMTGVEESGICWSEVEAESVGEKAGSDGESDSLEEQIKVISSGDSSITNCESESGSGMSASVARLSELAWKNLDRFALIPLMDVASFLDSSLSGRSRLCCLLARRNPDFCVGDLAFDSVFGESRRDSREAGREELLSRGRLRERCLGSRRES